MFFCLPLIWLALWDALDTTLAHQNPFCAPMYMLTLRLTHLKVISFATRFVALTTKQTMQQRIRHLATYLGVEGK